MISIKTKITGVDVVKTADKEQIQPQLPDVDPLSTRIEHRPDAALDAVIDKVQYNTQNGKRKVYVAVSFMEVTGRANGAPVTIERPIEIFLPAGQTEEDGQWIIATMRSLSLAARGGYITRALQDLRQVPWTKGSVRCGETDYGNNKVVPLQHPSEVAAIAFAIQRILQKKGFLDAEGNQVPVEVLARRYSKQPLEIDPLETNGDRVVELNAAPVEKKHIGKKCSQCSGDNVQRLDGCDTCLDCGHSKCS